MATFKGVELARMGTWDLFRGGKVTWSADDFADAVAASRDPDLGRPVLTPGHVDDRFERQGSPALGTVENLRVVGDRLVGDYTGVPGWLAASMAGAYPNRSIEGYAGVTTPGGKTYRLVLTAVALLGVTPPAITGLADLPAAVAAASESDPPRRLCATLSDMGLLRRAKHAPVAAALASTVAQAFGETEAGQNGAWVIDTEIGAGDMGDCLIVRDTDGDAYSVPFTEATDGSITFAPPAKVLTTYTPAPLDDDSGRLDAGDVVAASGRIRTDQKNPPHGVRHDQSTGDAVDVKALAEALGIDESDEAKLLAAAKAATDERTALTAERDELQRVAAAAAPPAGTTVIDAAKLAELQFQAAAGVDALSRVKADARGRFIAAAQGAGKLAPASKELAASLGELYDTDPARAQKIVDEMPAVIPVRPAGFTGSATGETTPHGFSTPEEESFMDRLLASSPLLAQSNGSQGGES